MCTRFNFPSKLRALKFKGDANTAHVFKTAQSGIKVGYLSTYPVCQN